MVLLLLFVLFGLSASAPVKQKYHHIVRRDNGDQFTVLKANCTADDCAAFNASAVSTMRCTCACNSESPIFLQHRNMCGRTVAECNRVVEFENGHVAPVMPLPLKGNIVGINTPIDWKGADISVDAAGNVSCSVSAAGYLTEVGWRQNPEKLFDLTVAFTNKRTYLRWRSGDGGKHTGKLIQVGLRCRETHDYCLFFRSKGVDNGGPVTLPVQQKPAEDKGEFNLIVAIICCALLVLTLVGSGILWVVCWRHQKDNLTKKIHLQFLYQQRLQQQNNFYHHQQAYGYPTPLQEGMVSGIEIQPSSEQEMCDFAPEQLQRQFAQPHTQTTPLGPTDPQQERARAMAAAAAAGQIDQLPPPPPYPSMKRKLYFSPEFFDPELMTDPPPLAEEFLYEVRRMIDFAKNRIRARRHIPSLVIIPETAEGEAEPEELEVEVDDLTEDLFIEAERQDADSPHSSGTSRDSGTNSLSDGSPICSDNSKPSTDKDKDSGVEESAEPAQKVTHWLNGCTDQSKPAKPAHSRLFRYFAARQAAQPTQEQDPPPVNSAALMRRYGLAPGSADLWMAKGSPQTRRAARGVVFPSESPFVKSLPRHAVKRSALTASSQANGF